MLLGKEVEGENNRFTTITEKIAEGKIKKQTPINPKPIQIKALATLSRMGSICKLFAKLDL